MDTLPAFITDSPDSIVTLPPDPRASEAPANKDTEPPDKSELSAWIEMAPALPLIDAPDRSDKSPPAAVSDDPPDTVTVAPALMSEEPPVTDTDPDAPRLLSPLEMTIAPESPDEVDPENKETTPDDSESSALLIAIVPLDPTKLCPL